MDTALLGLTGEIVSAYVSKNTIAASDIPALISNVHQSLASLGQPQAAVAERAELKPAVPAVPVKKSVTPDYIVCLEDGKKLKILKRHLNSAYDMTPDQYRARWGLPSNYPMVAPNYAKFRSEMALKLGLGRQAS